MVSIETIAPPEATTPATITVENLEGQKFKVRVVFYPNRVAKNIKRNRKNGRHDPDTLLGQLADVSEAGISEEDDDGDLDATERMRLRTEESLMEAAAAFCEQYESWDLSGPLRNGRDEVIVAAGDVIPLEAEYIRWVPTWLRAEINQGVQEILHPPLRELRPSRKRS